MKGKTYGKKVFIKMLAAICSICTLFIMFPGDANNAYGVPLKDKYNIKTVDLSGADANIEGYKYYHRILEEYSAKGYEDAHNSEIIIKAWLPKATSNGKVSVEEGLGGRHEKALIWDENTEWIEWEVDIHTEGLYEIEIEYYPLKGSGSDIQRTLYIDDEIPFFEAYNLIFARNWKEEGEPIVNNIGDEVRPGMTESPLWKTVTVFDGQGVYNEPLKLYFSRGNHTIKMDLVDQPVAITKIILKTPEYVPTYEEVERDYKENGYQNSGSTKKFQAESTAIFRSDTTITRENDEDPVTEPLSRGARKLNVIGGYRWRRGSQEITWKFDVPEDGLYKLCMRVNQSFSPGLPVYRRVEIDGKVPFKELEAYQFDYDLSWRMETLQDQESGEPYCFYLKKGTHSLTMTAKMGKTGFVINSIMEDIKVLSELLNNIFMLTGSDPDRHFNYDLENRIPNLIPDLEHLADKMQKNADMLSAISNKRSSTINNFIMIKEQIEQLLYDIDRVPKRLKELTDSLSTLSTFMMALKDQPLTIDYFILTNPNEFVSSARANVLQRLMTTVYNFIYSFKVDYDRVGSIYEDSDGDELTVIDVWISRGKEWGEIIKAMADEEFTPNKGIAINMNILPASQLNAGGINALLLAINSGKAPDVACAVMSASAVEFAIRDAVYDLSNFEDFDEVKTRFLPAIMVPFKYQEGYYAIPETMNFKVMFYRKDIFEKLDIDLPETWSDLYKKVLPVLNNNKMQFYYPLHDFTTFLFQQGGNFYTDDGMQSALNSPEAFKAAKEYFDLYTCYGIPVQANFFNRMRTGEMPIGIEGYSTYIMLSTAAPELFGRWGVTLIPGHRRADGTIDRSTGGVSVDSSIIINQSEKKESAWEFLKWWTSDEVQIRFAHELESLLGVQARWNSANLEAFLSLPWNRQDLNIIKQSWEWSKEQPVVLGGYFTSRHLINSFNRVVVSGQNVRDSLEKAVEDIDRELRNKQEEYGIKPVTD